MADSEQKQGFVIRDRRASAENAEAEPTPDAAPAEPPPTKWEPPPEPSADPSSDNEKAERPLPPVDFTTFVLSLGSSALMHLGEIEHPHSGVATKDLAMAKHTIDLLSMLEAKTKGNLTGHEDQLLESLLYDLRLRFVTASKSG